MQQEEICKLRACVSEQLGARSTLIAGIVGVKDDCIAALDARIALLSAANDGYVAEVDALTSRLSRDTSMHAAAVDALSARIAREKNSHAVEMDALTSEHAAEMDALTTALLRAQHMHAQASESVRDKSRGVAEMEAQHTLVLQQRNQLVADLTENCFRQKKKLDDACLCHDIWSSYSS